MRQRHVLFTVAVLLLFAAMGLTLVPHRILTFWKRDISPNADLLNENTQDLSIKSFGDVLVEVRTDGRVFSPTSFVNVRIVIVAPPGVDYDPSSSLIRITCPTIGGMRQQFEHEVGANVIPSSHDESLGNRFEWNLAHVFGPGETSGMRDGLHQFNISIIKGTKTFILDDISIRVALIRK